MVNGQHQKFSGIETIADLLRELQYQGRFFAVALNRVLVPRSQYGETRVQENDAVEILMPLQGG